MSSIICECSQIVYIPLRIYKRAVFWSLFGVCKGVPLRINNNTSWKQRNIGLFCFCCNIPSFQPPAQIWLFIGLSGAYCFRCCHRYYFRYDGFLEAVLCSLLHRSPVAWLLLMPAPQSYLPYPAPSSSFTVTLTLPAPFHTWGKQTWLGLCEIKGVQSGK